MIQSMLFYTSDFTTGELHFQASESLTDCAKGTVCFCQVQGLRKYGLSKAVKRHRK